MAQPISALAGIGCAVFRGARKADSRYNKAAALEHSTHIIDNWYFILGDRFFMRNISYLKEPIFKSAK